MGPILGGILAAGLYEYLYCPDPEVKNAHDQVFQKDPSGKYKDVESGLYRGEPDDLCIKPGSILTADLEKAEKKDLYRDPSGEVLSSV